MNKKAVNAGQTAETSRKKFHDRVIVNLWCWLFMAAAVIFYILFQGYPILCSIWYSLLDWSGLTTNASFVGLANYRELLEDQLFWNAFANSLKYTAMIVPLELVVSLFFAYILNNEKLKGRGIFRTIYFIPVITTASVVGIIMIFILGVQGPLNYLLNWLHITDTSVNFLGTAKYAMPTLVAISLWKDCGTYMIYWLAGLQGVSSDVYEAAAIDGAGRGKTFFYIVLPLIAPTGGIIAILCAINSLKVFDIIKTMTEGGPFYATDVIATFVYRTAFSSEIGMPRLGYASAAAVFFGITVIVVGLILNMVKNRLGKMNQEVSQ
ncbi:MAG: sugar ABC transporter permease [Lachnospiraceae bacterium]|nr:sugar ABC transporter permease [Lachnospiraceae bacterium]